MFESKKTTKNCSLVSKQSDYEIACIVYL